MTVRPFLRYPDPRLRTSCAPVIRIDDEVRAIWTDMLDSMYAMPGVGLAAPQIGVVRRLAVVDCSDSCDQPIRMANPELLWTSSETATRSEGSPNIPGVWESVSRPTAIRVKFIGEDGAVQERLLLDLWAVSAQHQIDHLNGMMFIDRLRPVKRRMALDRMKKLARRAEKDG